MAKSAYLPHQPPLSLDVPGRYLLEVNTGYAPNSFTIYDYPYVVIKDSLEECRKYIREANRGEQGYFPRGGYRWSYGHWSQETIEQYNAVLEIVHQGIF